MRSRRFTNVVFLSFTVLVAAAALVAAPPLQAGSHSTGKLMRAANTACRELAREGLFCEPLGESRRELVEGVGYYTLQVKVGPGEHDVILVHRVVSEPRHGQPGHTRSAVLLIHGAMFGFEPTFLGLSLYSDPPQVSFPAYLARHGVDTWGISFRWAQVPLGFPEQTFMADWGMDVSVSDARVALRIARTARGLQGQGSQRIHVLGYSFGAWTAMALASAEAAVPLRRRDLGGLIPVEGTFKADPADPVYIAPWCDDAAAFQGELDAGVFGFDRSFPAFINQLALDSPDEPSPLWPEVTNAQFKLVSATSPQGVPGEEWFHNNAGTFDEYGMPTGLKYTDFVFSCREVTHVYGYDPVRYVTDVNAITCDEAEVPWDDHLADVRVPVLYVGVGGGFGALGEYQTRLVGSRDVRTLIVRDEPEDRAELDIGHVDVFWSPAMRKPIWEPILSWLRAH